MKAINIYLLFVLCVVSHQKALCSPTEVSNVEATVSNADNATAPLYPPQLQSELKIPSNCTLLYSCYGSGFHRQLCQSTLEWRGVGVNVTLTCNNGMSGTLNYSGINAAYTLPCGSVLGDEKTDIQYFNASKLPTDSPDYRRSIVAGSSKGCLENTTYITRTNVTGGVPNPKSCEKAGAIELLPYDGLYQFLAC